ncbi:DUF4188 domain-containing protein [Amorphus sp. MBR-141]
MGTVIDQRMTAHIDGDFVVFLIGVRFNKPWKVHKWLPVVRAMMRMTAELDRLPAAETGFLGRSGAGPGTMVQYWRSFDHLEAYARSTNAAHFPAWTAFNRRMKASRGDVGIWHETFVIRSGEYETLYSGMPPFGLGKAAELVPATGTRSEARARMTG